MFDKSKFSRNNNSSGRNSNFKRPFDRSNSERSSRFSSFKDSNSSDRPTRFIDAKEGEGSDRAPRSSDRPYSDRAPRFNRFGDKPSFDRAPRFNRFGDKPSSDRAPRFNRFGDKPSFDRSPRFSRDGDKPSFDRAPRSNRFGDKPSYDRAPRFNRDGEGADRAPRSNRFGDKPSFDRAPRFNRDGEGSDRSSRPSRFGDRKPYQNRERSFSRGRTGGSFNRYESKPFKNEKYLLSESQEYLSGYNSVRLAIQSGKRKIYKMYVNQEKDWTTEPFSLLKEQALSKEIEFVLTTDDELNEILPDTNHQGLILQCSKIKPCTLLELLEMPEISKIIALDQVQDPQNFGAVIRSAAYFGADAIIITGHQACPPNATVSKSSAGLLEISTICEVLNLSQALTKLKDKGFWIVGTGLDGENIFNFEPPAKYVVVFGNENKGLREMIKQNCDYLITIPGKEVKESLNISVATGITLSILTKGL